MVFVQGIRPPTFSDFVVLVLYVIKEQGRPDKQSRRQLGEKTFYRGRVHESWLLP